MVKGCDLFGQVQVRILGFWGGGAGKGEMKFQQRVRPQMEKSGDERREQIFARARVTSKRRVWVLNERCSDTSTEAFLNWPTASTGNTT